MIRSFLKSLLKPAPRVLRETVPTPVMVEAPAMTVDQIILNMRKDGLSYRQIQAETGCTYHRVRKVCLSA